MAKSKGTKKSKRAPRAGLHPLDVVFALEYLVDLNATQAYLRARPGVTYNTASSEGPKLLVKPRIREFIDERLQKSFDELGVRPVDVIREYRAIALSRISDVLKWDAKGNVTYTASDKLPDSVLAAISEVTDIQTEGGRRLKVRMHNKLEGLEKLAIYAMRLLPDPDNLEGRGAVIQMVPEPTRAPVRMDLVLPPVVADAVLVPTNGHGDNEDTDPDEDED
jgi:phage terminase small subunit